MRISDWSSDVGAADLAGVDAHQHFRRRADDVVVAEVHAVQVRRRIEATDRTIELHRVGTERRRQTLRRHDLHAVAGGDVVLHVAHHLAVWLDTEARFERQLGDAGDWRGIRWQRAREQGRSGEHTSELQSLMRISYAAF